jgi:hypothetical protein
VGNFRDHTWGIPVILDIGHVIFDRGNHVTAKTHGYGAVEILDSHGQVLQTRTVNEGYGHVPERDRFQFHVDPGHYIVHLRMVGPSYEVPDRCPPLVRTQSANVHVHQSAKVQLGEDCVSNSY